MVPRRALASVARTTAYGSLSAVLGITDAGTAQLVDAVVVGAVVADYVTWLFRSLMLLPSYVLGGAYDACINILFGWILFRVVGLDCHLEGEGVAVAFLAFLLVTAVKITCYSVGFLREWAGDPG
jgi:riboflavin transporter FmnP